MFKTNLLQAALTCAEPNAGAWDLARRGLHASHLGMRMFCALVAVLLMMALTLPGCGPGTGGTGVGPVSSFGVTPILFSGAINGVSTTGAGIETGTETGALPGVIPPFTAPAAQPPGFTLGTTSGGPTSAAATCPADCAVAALTLKLEGERVQLQGPCFNFVSQSPLAIAASGSAVLAGTYQTTSQISNVQGGPTSNSTSTSSVNATLMLEFAGRQADSSSSSVTISVRDSAGALLVGPAILLRVSVAPGASPAGPQTGGVLSCP